MPIIATVAAPHLGGECTESEVARVYSSRLLCAGRQTAVRECRMKWGRHRCHERASPSEVLMNAQQWPEEKKDDTDGHQHGKRPRHTNNYCIPYHLATPCDKCR